MPVTFTNAILYSLDPPSVVPGAIRIVDEAIAEVGPAVRSQPGDDVIDCGGAALMPGLVNGHTHLYSALAVGMPAPPRVPKNFHEILELIWWRLDRAHDAQSVETSGQIGALDALHCGTTTLIDHHASPDFIAGSLDALEKGIADIGLRAVLCYETTDRHGATGAEAGIAENRRYLQRRAAIKDGRFAALVGAHAAFTMSDPSLRASVELAAEFKTGVHIHVAEDPCDDTICRQTYGMPLVHRLQRCGLLSDRGSVASQSIMAHATHLSPQDAAAISPRLAAVAHNPRSNMNNQVGYAPVAHLRNVQLGTDGMGGDMFAEARAAFFKARDAQAPIGFAEIAGMLAHSARTAGRLLGRRLGVLEPGAAADIVLTDYIPATRLDSTNALGHLLFALCSRHVRSVMIGGRWALRDRDALLCDESRIRREAGTVAAGLWARMP